MSTVKCVVWDLDGTVWPGVAIERAAGAGLEPEPRALRAMELLARRGIVNSVASRTDPSLAETVAAHPDLADRFVAPQLGWGHKSDAIARIAAELGIAAADVAFVDDSPFERAEVAAVLPEVRVFSPEELLAALDSPVFRPERVTADARARPARYRDEATRRAAERDFRGTREEFLRSCDIRLSVAPAGPDDVERVAELVERTHRFNATTGVWPVERIRAVVSSPDWFVPVARLRDRFGGYGLIAAALIERRRAWQVRMFTVSCRAAGRDVPAGFLRWILDRAGAGGAQALRVEVRDAAANLELRVLLRTMGFQLAEAQADGLLVLARPVGAEPPPAPDWLRVSEDTGVEATGVEAAGVEAAGVEPAGVEATVRALLAEVLGVDQSIVDAAPAGASLLHGPLGLSSLAGARLLAAVRERFGVDLAAADLALRSLESIATLRDFLASSR